MIIISRFTSAKKCTFSYSSTFMLSNVCAHRNSHSPTHKAHTVFGLCNSVSGGECESVCVPMGALNRRTKYAS